MHNTNSQPRGNITHQVSANSVVFHDPNKWKKGQHSLFETIARRWATCSNFISKVLPKSYILLFTVIHQIKVGLSIVTSLNHRAQFMGNSILRIHFVQVNNKHFRHFLQIISCVEESKQSKTPIFNISK